MYRFFDSGKDNQYWYTYCLW